jgi:hypothetical protein
MNYCATKTVYEMTGAEEFNNSNSFYKDLPMKGSTPAEKLPVHEVDFINHERLILI